MAKKARVETPGSALLRWMAESKLGPSALADAIGVTPRYVYMLVKDQREPSMGLARKIKHLTGVDFLVYFQAEAR